MKRILVTDDDIHIGNVLEDALTQEGYAVTRAYSGTEAQLILSKEKPDLILLDLMLPGLSGEALRLIPSGQQILISDEPLEQPAFMIAYSRGEIRKACRLSGHDRKPRRLYEAAYRGAFQILGGHIRSQ